MRETESKVNKQTGKYKSGECTKNGEMTLFNVNKNTTTQEKREKKSKYKYVH